jgi:hypothetical protein
VQIALSDNINANMFKKQYFFGLNLTKFLEFLVKSLHALWRFFSNFASVRVCAQAQGDVGLHSEE